jgi:hypothetical protein
VLGEIPLPAPLTPETLRRWALASLDAEESLLRFFE